MKTQLVATQRLLDKSRCGYLAAGGDTHRGVEFSLRSGGRANLDVFKFNVEIKCQHCELNAFFGGHRTYHGRELVMVTPRAGLPDDRVLFWVKSDGRQWNVTPPKTLTKCCEHIQALFQEYTKQSDSAVQKVSQ